MKSITVLMAAITSVTLISGLGVTTLVEAQQTTFDDIGSNQNNTGDGDPNAQPADPTEPDADPAVTTDDEVATKRQAYDLRTDAAALVDSDDDGVSDYDERALYGTDPTSAATNAEPVTVVDGTTAVRTILTTDAEKFVAGFNPVTNELIVFEDPRIASDTLISANLSVNVIKTSVERPATIADGYNPDELAAGEILVTEPAVRLSGRAPAFSYVTVQIFSVPTIVTVRADRDGVWEYTLKKELASGDHQVFATTVDNTGRVLAKTSPVPFVQTAAAAGFTGAVPTSENETGRGFLSLPMILIGVALLVVFILGAITFAGAAARKAAVNGPGVPGETNDERHWDEPGLK